MANGSRLMRTIAHFELLDKLGAGGMGEVFKARDTRLNRFVAIKLLPETAHAAARERFQREALAIAALNHPNICTLHEAGEQDGRPYLVMELLEGETLYSRLSRGPVPPAQVGQWGAEIADALQAAHAKGILHRDLKPGNIFITQRGAVKVLDFGLAQFASGPSSDSDAATIAGAPPPAPGAALPPLTNPGTALGTYAYMSPEQARGEPTDARSDLFSLGVVLYEMAGGRAPFRGRTSADVTAAILMLQPPPPSSLRPELPPKLDDIVAQCLEKEPEMRYQSAADLRVSLRRLQGASSSSGPASSPSPSAAALAGAPSSHPSAVSVPASGPPPSAPAAVPARRPWLWPAAAAVVIVAALAWWRLAPHAPAAPAAPQLQFRQLTFSGQVLDAALSPDGKFLAHVDGSPQGTSLRLMAVTNGSDTQIMPPSPECCQAPTFSPDGSSIYFTEYAKLLSLPVLGGEVRTIADNVCSGAAFSPGGKRIAYLAAAPGGDTLMLARADGTQARRLNAPSPLGFNGRCWLGGPLNPDAPAWSPDGRWIAVDESGNSSTAFSDHLVLVDAASGRVQPLGHGMAQGASDLAWLPDGSGLLFTNSIPATAPAQLWEVTYPGGRLVQLSHDLQGFERVSVAAQSGAIALQHIDPRYSVWAQSTPGGAFTELPGGGADQAGSDGLTWTSHGRLIATHTIAGKDQLWIETGTAPAQPIPVVGLPPVIAVLRAMPNHQLVFQAIDPANESGWDLFRVNTDGTALVQLTHGLNAEWPTPMLGNKTLVYLGIYTAGGKSHQRLWSVPLAGGKPRELSSREFYTNFVLPMPGQRHLLALAILPGPATGVVEVSADGATVVPQNPRQYRGSFASPYAITPDGRALTGVINSGNVGNIWASPLNGGPLYEITHFTSQGIANYAFGPGGRLAVSRGSQNGDAVLATGLATRPH